MPEIVAAPASGVTSQMLAVLREAFDGPAEQWSYFTDVSPDSGLLHTLGPLTAGEVSRTIGGTSIAAHARHILFGLRASTSWIEGDRAPRDWRESWNTDPVDDVEWNDLRLSLRAAFENLAAAVEAHAEDSTDTMGEIIGTIAHVAYHLGAIRGKVVCGKEE